MLGSLIFYIIIIVVIVSIRNKSKSGNNRNSGGSRPENREYSRPIVTNFDEHNQPISGKYQQSGNTMGQFQQTMPAQRTNSQMRESQQAGEVRQNVVNRAAQKSNQTTANLAQKAAGNTAAARAMQNDALQEGSTTEYLRKKAEQDKVNHRKEELNQERENRQSYGHIRYAKRWLDGEAVPSGARMIKCTYCGAENIMPMHDGSKYNCYFCREEL